MHFQSIAHVLFCHFYIEQDKINNLSSAKPQSLASMNNVSIIYYMGYGSPMDCVKYKGRFYVPTGYLHNRDVIGDIDGSFGW